MWGALFCGLGAGISFVIFKYLPEFFAVVETRETKNDATQQNVNIVLPGENPHGVPYGGSEEFEHFATEGNVSEVASQIDQENMVEEVEEVRGDFAETPRIQDPHESTEDETENPEELPDLDEDGRKAPPSVVQTGFQPQGISDITGTSGRGSTIDVLGHEADSEEIARAIRTALKKDQKG
jgi:hypothetical protein